MIRSGNCSQYSDPVLSVVHDKLINRRYSQKEKKILTTRPGGKKSKNGRKEGTDG